MKFFLPILALAVLAAAPIGISGDAPTVSFAGKVRDFRGRPIAGLTIRLTGSASGQAHSLTVRTQADGSFSISVPAGTWRGIPDNDELLARGYFCVPGWNWCPELNGCPNFGGNPIPGEIYNPGDPGSIFLIALPTQPVITVSKSPGQAAAVNASFEMPSGQVVWVQAAKWAVERSCDLAGWEPVTEITSTGPVSFSDAPTAANPCAFYRARFLGWVSVP